MCSETEIFIAAAVNECSLMNECDNIILSVMFLFLLTLSTLLQEAGVRDQYQHWAVSSVLSTSLSGCLSCSFIF